MLPSEKDPGKPPTERETALFSLWTHVEEHFEDERAHAAFLAACDEARALPFAARLYRSKKGSDSEREIEIAQEQLEKITGLAFSQMEAARTPPAQKNRLLVLAAALVSIALIGACVYLIGL